MDTIQVSATPPANTKKQPIPTDRLDGIATTACDSIFQFVDGYDHSRTESWNSNIISAVLKSLTSEASVSGQQPQYKFAVTSTIIQHTAVPRVQTTADDPSPPNGASDGVKSIGGTSDSKTLGRRGMHSATGAYWNNEKDGMWSWKYVKAEEKGFDVVISIMWVSIV